MIQSPSSAPTVADDVIFQRMSDGAILLSTEEEVYFGLNEVGAQIWKGLERQEELVAICRSLRERYPDVDEDRIESDVMDLLQELHREGLVSWSESRPDSNGDGA